MPAMPAPTTMTSASSPVLSITMATQTNCGVRQVNNCRNGRAALRALLVLARGTCVDVTNGSQFCGECLRGLGTAVKRRRGVLEMRDAPRAVAAHCNQHLNRVDFGLDVVRTRRDHAGHRAQQRRIGSEWTYLSYFGYIRCRLMVREDRVQVRVDRRRGLDRAPIEADETAVVGEQRGVP